MMFPCSLVAVASVLLPLVQAHVVLFDPMPYLAASGGDALENAPLAKDGSNFPCKVTPASSGGSPARIYVPGVADTFNLVGSAVHSGGSCQVSITYDNPPNKDSIFKVVQSYEGGCPMIQHGNIEGLNVTRDYPLPLLDVTLPTGIKSGGAVFVWTWFNKSGNREMYMNCAPITIGGSETSDTLFQSLPDMFVANLDLPSSQCTTKENYDIVFPHPGTNVLVAPAGPEVAFGPACDGGPATPVGGNTPVAAPSPSAGTPALVGGGQVVSSVQSVGTVFTPINAPTAVPTTMMTMTSASMASTMMTMTSASMASTSAAAMPTVPATAVSTMPASSMPTMPAASSPTGSASTGTTAPVTSLSLGDACTMSSMMCVAGEPSTWAVCDGSTVVQAGGAVPPGTWCDPSTNQFAMLSSMTAPARTVKRRADRRSRLHLIKKAFGHSHHA